KADGVSGTGTSGVNRDVLSRIHSCRSVPMTDSGIENALGLICTFENRYTYRSGRQILWLSSRQPVFSRSGIFLQGSLGSNAHKAQALSGRRIDALATQFGVWLPESRIDDPHATASIRHKRTVLMGRVWGSAVAFAARSQRIRRAERHKHCNEVLVRHS